MAMLVGKNMAYTGVMLESFLFNPPFISLSLPLEPIKHKKVKHGFRLIGSLVKAAFLAVKGDERQQSKDQFEALTVWVPCLFVNPDDYICSEYNGYFEHRQKMDDKGIGEIGRLATRHTLLNLFMDAFGKGSGSDPLHLIPSVNLTINRGQSRNFIDAHGINQWWRPDLHLEYKLYHYK